MTPIKIVGSTHKYEAPDGWDTAVHGECETLHVRLTGSYAESAWLPTLEEIELLKQGRPIILRCYNIQPAVAVYLA